MSAGGRRGEFTSLTWDGPDLDVGEIHFAGTKTRVDRIVPIGRILVSEFVRLKVQTLQDRRPFTWKNNTNRTWDRICGKAGVRVTIHDMRWTFISRMVWAGVPMPTVMKLAGHKSIATTQRYYTWVSRDDLRAAVDKVDQRVG